MLFFMTVDNSSLILISPWRSGNSSDLVSSWELLRVWSVVDTWFVGVVELRGLLGFVLGGGGGTDKSKDLDWTSGGEEGEDTRGTGLTGFGCFGGRETGLFWTGGDKGGDTGFDFTCLGLVDGGGFGRVAGGGGTSGVSLWEETCDDGCER